jgi:hypothetical protein
LAVALSRNKDNILRVNTDSLELGLHICFVWRLMS